MPYYALIGHDGPGSLELRKRHRDAHLAKLRALDELTTVFLSIFLAQDNSP